MPVDTHAVSAVVFTFLCTCYTFSFSKFSLYSQNAGAVIGKGGKNIKALRTDVSTSILNTLSIYFFEILFYIFYFSLHW